jgi:rRNA maturation endonuclease Nob1
LKSSKLFLSLLAIVLPLTLPTRHRWSNPAKNAYEAAVQSLTSELTLDERKVVWLQDQTSMADVQSALTTALHEYESKSKGSKVRKWLSNCSSRVMYFSSE